jgi:DNA polymerase II small subunit/DNA polymerase delta subunit B
MKKKTWKIILGVVLLLLVSGGLYAYKEFTRKVKDLTHVKAGVSIDASQLLTVFETNEAEGNSKYLDKIIAVSGKVKSVEKNNQGHCTVILGDENSMSSVRCSMDSVHQQEVASLATGTVITMKGACTGFNKDELLGSDVILNRCVVEN